MKSNERGALHLAEEEARVRALCEPLRSAPVSVPDAEVARAEREQLVPFLAERIRHVPAQREKAARARRLGMGLAAAAVLVVVGSAAAWLAYQPEMDGGAFSLGTKRAGERSLAEGLSEAFTGEAAVTTPADSSARVVTEGGVRIDVAPATRARVTSRSMARVDLMDGSVTLDVPPQAPGSSVRVITPDATVTVHGTNFTVTYDAAAGAPRTCVRVEHGKVAVERRGKSELLTDGQSSGCDVAPRDPASAVEGSSLPKTGRASRAHGSTLAQENALLQQALAAEQAGDLKRAEEKLRSLLAKYPQSGLSKEAARALARVEKARAER